MDSTNDNGSSAVEQQHASLEVGVEKRRSAISLASLKAISICIMNGKTSPFKFTNLWNCILGDSSLATVSKLTGSE